MMQTFELVLNYGQIALYYRHLVDPIPEWVDAHFDQGFSWMPGSVNFTTLEEGGPTRIMVRRSITWAPRSDAIRIIAVPFQVPNDGALVLSTIPHEPEFKMVPGEYRLIYEHGISMDRYDPTDPDTPMWCDFTFVPVTEPIQAEIIRADPKLSPPTPLVMTAEPMRFPAAPQASS